MKALRELFINKVYGFLLPGLKGSEQKLAGRLKNGVTITLYNLPSTVALLVIAALLHILPYVLFFMFSYGLIRTFAYGIHLKSCYLCAAWGFLNFIGGGYLATQISMQSSSKIIIFSICYFLLAVYAPGNNEYQPYSKKRYMLLKTQTLVVTSLLFLASFYFSSRGNIVYSNVIVLAMIAQSINVLPITYMLFGEKRSFEYTPVKKEVEPVQINENGKKANKAVWYFQVYGTQFMLAVVVLSQLRTGQPFWHNAPSMDKDYYDTLEDGSWTDFGKSFVKKFGCKK